MIKEITKEEIKISVPKFTRPDVIEELTVQNIEDIIISQKIELENLKNEILRKEKCVEHYQSFLM